jgi:hypothetical protein
MITSLRQHDDPPPYPPRTPARPCSAPSSRHRSWRLSQGGHAGQLQRPRIVRLDVLADPIIDLGWSWDEAKQRWHSGGAEALLNPESVSSARSDYYGAPAPSRTFNGRRIYPTVLNGLQAAGAMRDGSRVHREPIDQLGTQLCPGSIAMVTPQTFAMASPGTPNRLQSRPSTTDGRALHPDPYPPNWSRCHAYGALCRWFLSYAV